MNLQLKNEINSLSRLDINNNMKFYHVEFDAWKHQTNEKVWASLLQTIPLQLEKDLNLFELLDRRITHAWNRLDTVVRHGVHIFTVATIAIFAIILIRYLQTDAWLINPAYSASPMLGMLFLSKNIFSFFGRMFSPLGVNLSSLVNSKSLKDHVKSVHEFTDELKHMIKVNIGEEGRLILYIDDLDRCTPDNVASVIEALNVFLDSEQCVFILGMDRDKVAKSIGVKYSDLCENNNHINYGNRFLEKIIQLPINLPFMGDADVRNYSNQLFPTGEDPAPVDYSKNKNEFKEIDMPVVLKDDLKEAFLYLTPRSPRNIKRFLNKAWFYYLLSQVDNETFKNVDPKYLGFWLLIHELYPDHVKSMKGKSLDWSAIIEHPIKDPPYLYEKIFKFASMVNDNNTDKSDNYWLLKYFDNNYKIDPYIKLTDSVEI